MNRCSICKRTVPAREENAAFPFCSPRCQALDLSRWFTGSYRVAARPSADDEELIDVSANAGEEPN